MSVLGISKLELLLMLPVLKLRIKKAFPNDTIYLTEALETIAWLFKRFSRAADKEYEQLFSSWERTFYSMANLLAKEEKMAKFELGITVGEIVGMLPKLAAEAWGHYSDDKKITTDEGLDFVGEVLRSMADAADEDAVAAFLVAQAEALEALAPLFFEEEVIDVE